MSRAGYSSRGAAALRIPGLTLALTVAGGVLTFVQLSLAAGIVLKGLHGLGVVRA